MQGFIPPPPADASLTERFRWLVMAVAFRGHWLGRREPARLSVTEMVGARLRRTVERFSALLARFEAGTLTPPKPRPARPRPEAAEPAETDPKPPRPEQVKLPRHFGWLREMSGDHEITRLGQGLRALVTDDARMRALIEAAPRVGRLLRPILWMTGVPWIPPILAPAKPDWRMKRWMAGNVAKQDPPLPPPPSPPFFASLMPTPEQEEAAARRHASRPGGLFWDGKRMFYS